MLERWKQHFAKHSWGWILLGLLAISFYGNWQNGAKLARVCDMALYIKELDTVGIDIVANHAAWERRTALLSTDQSLYGKIYRWQRVHGRELEKACSEGSAFGSVD